MDVNALREHLLRIEVIRIGQHHLDQLASERVVLQAVLAMVEELSERLGRPPLLARVTGGTAAAPVRQCGSPSVSWIEMTHRLPLQPPELP
jgi:hypothetical protein